MLYTAIINGINYRLNSSKLTATVWSSPKYQYEEDIKIPSHLSHKGKNYTVTSIYGYQGNWGNQNRGAFCGCKFLKSVIIPNTIKTIGECAFWNCKSLVSISFPEGLEEIGNAAFEYCHNLTDISFPKSIRKIGRDAFADTKWLEKQPDGLIYIGDVLYVYKRYDEAPTDISVEIRHGTTRIVGGAFQFMNRLKSIVIPNTVKYIGNRVFESCSSLTSIDIPNSVVEIGEMAFADCSSLISINIPNSVNKIGAGVFYGCSSLKSVILSENITSLLTTVGNLEDGSQSFFEDCSSLTTISIPAKIEEIGIGIFNGCKSLESIIVHPNNKVYDSRANCNAIIEKRTNTLVAGCKSTIIPNNIKAIGSFAFGYCSSLKSITIPDSVNIIETDAFYGCCSLSSIFLSNGITTIKEDAFPYNDSLEICIPKGQKALFIQMGLQEFEDLLVERDNEEFTILLNLAKAYEKGVGVIQNIAQSALYYTQAAEKGSTEAAYQLAEWYAIGENLAKDIHKALQYYQLAAKLSYKDAQLKAEQIQCEIEAEHQRYNEQMAAFMNEQIMSYAQQTISQEGQPTYLFFDTECNGLPQFYDVDVHMTNNWPNVIQLAWIVTDEQGNVLKRKSHIITPNGFEINDNVANLTGITTTRAMREGIELTTALSDFISDVSNAQLLIGHNIDFDMKVVGCELYRNDMDYERLLSKNTLCTMKRSTYFCAIPKPRGKFNDYKWPKLEELYRKLFGSTFSGAHDALADVEATMKCYFELKKKGIL